MPDVLVVPDSIARQADVPSLVSECFWTDGGVGAPWVHVAGELDIAAAPQLSGRPARLRPERGWLCSTCASSRSWTAPACA
jgi:hypothetical protein